MNEKHWRDRYAEFIAMAAIKAGHHVDIDEHLARLVMERGVDVQALLADYLLGLQGFTGSPVREFTTRQLPTLGAGSSIYAWYMTGSRLLNALRRDHVIHQADIAIASLPLPEGAEYWAVIPYWRAVSHDYWQAVINLLNLVIKRQRTISWRSWQVFAHGLRNLAPTPRSAWMWDRIWEAQGRNDLLVIPVASPAVFAGYSPRIARLLLTRGAFGLGLFATVCLLVDNSDVWSNNPQGFVLSCVGDDIVPTQTDEPASVPCLEIGDRECRVALQGFDNKFAEHLPMIAIYPRDFT